MPVSFKVAEHSPNPVTLTPAQIHPGLTPEQLLAGACAHQYETAGEILGSSFSKATPAEKSPFIRRLTNPFAKKKKAASGMASEPLPLTIPNIIPTPNGLVNTIISAYNRHHNLILRPDDVWLAILTQFNFYVNANAELLRANFVAHEGRQELKVSKQQSRATMDFGQMSREMVGLMTSVIVDPTLQAWVLPDFSTTTTNDRTVAAIVMMSTLKAYFEYVFESIECGIPQVTLAGEKADWENILQRLEKLKEYGIETIAWYHLLVPVISRFVEAFDDPSGSANVDFWQKVAHFQPGGSGPSHYSGWISAFCVFNEEGGWIGNRLKESDPRVAVDPQSMLATEFWQQHLFYAVSSIRNLDGTPFHLVESKNIPASYVEVDVKLRDVGEEPENCVMTAGVIGTLVSYGGNAGDTVQPVTGWWMFTKKTVRKYHS